MMSCFFPKHVGLEEAAGHRDGNVRATTWS